MSNRTTKAPLSFSTLASMALAAGLLFACSPTVDQRGFIKDDDNKTQIISGHTTREQVMELLGSPSSRSNFGAETWYYVSMRKEGRAFMRPEITEQNVTRIVFDESGVVKTMQDIGPDQAREIDIVNRTTPTEGHSLGFFEQLLGNVGRFNAPGGTNSAGLPGARGPQRPPY